MRLILFTGAGGAGVTTLAAATAVAVAVEGHAVRLLSRDPDALDAVLGPRTAQPAGLTLDSHGSRSGIGAEAAAVADWLKALLGWAGLEPELVDEIPLLPGAAALMALLRAGESAETAVVDLGPVADTLPLLHLLHVAAGSVLDIQPHSGRTSRLVAPLLSRLVDLPRPGEAVQQTGRRAAERLRRLRAMVRDGAVTSVRVVLPGDRRAATVLRETATVCGLHGIALDAIFDRGGSAGVGDAGLLDTPWCAGAPVGAAALLDLARVYGGRSPLDILCPPAVPVVELVDSGAELVLPLPQRPAEEFRVSRRGARLDLRAGPWRRAFLLPDELHGMRGRRAWHDGAVFRVTFER